MFTITMNEAWELKKEKMWKFNFNRYYLIQKQANWTQLKTFPFGQTRSRVFQVINHTLREQRDIESSHSKYNKTDIKKETKTIHCCKSIVVASVWKSQGCPTSIKNDRINWSRSFAGPVGNLICDRFYNQRICNRKPGLTNGSVFFGAIACTKLLRLFA